MGFVLLGIYAWNAQALPRSVMTMLAHGLSAAALFMLSWWTCSTVFILEIWTRWVAFGAIAPKMSFMALFFTVAAVGMPGSGKLYW